MSFTNEQTTNAIPTFSIGDISREKAGHGNGAISCVLNKFCAKLTLHVLEHLLAELQQLDGIWQA